MSVKYIAVPLTVPDPGTAVNTTGVTNFLSIAYRRTFTSTVTFQRKDVFTSSGGIWGYGIQFVSNVPTVPTSTLPPIHLVSETFLIRHVLAQVTIDDNVQNGCESNILQYCTVRIV